jgi:hypothetical protein
LEELTPEEHQKFPGDYEAQVSQGRTTFHSDEHLATSDRGVVMLRRFLKTLQPGHGLAASINQGDGHQDRVISLRRLLHSGSPFKAAALTERPQLFYARPGSCSKFDRMLKNWILRR